MKKLALMLLLLLPTTAFAASTKPNPADFTLTVHVISSRFNCAGGCSQILETTTDTLPVELTRFSNTVLGVLAPVTTQPVYPSRYMFPRQITTPTISIAPTTCSCPTAPSAPTPSPASVSPPRIPSIRDTI
jgi:hypothetical protein